MKTIVQILITGYLIFGVGGIYAQDIEKVIKSKPFAFSGNINLNGGIINQSGFKNPYPDYQYGISASLNVKVYGFSFPMYIGYRNNQFNRGFAFPKLRFSPQYKWIKLHVGDVFMNFNRYTLNNRTIRGAGVELTPGKFRFKMLYGKIRDFNAVRDTLDLVLTPEETFTRRTLGLSMGIGGAKNRVDIHALRTIDELNSRIDETPLNPQDNTVLGMDVLLTFFKKIKFKSQFGASQLTRNVGLFETPNPKLFRPTINATSALNFAGDAKLSYSGKYFGINLSSAYVQPFYSPLSIGIFRTDRINYAAGGNLRLFKSKFIIRGKVGVENNNLSNTKAATTERIIYNGSLIVIPLKSVTLNVNYSNIRQDNIIALQGLDRDLNFYIQNATLNANLTHRFGDDVKVSNSLTVGRYDYTSVGDSLEILGESTSMNYNLSNNLNFKDLRLRTSASIFFRNTDDLNTEAQIYGFRTRAGYQIIEDKLNASLQYSLSFIDRESLREGTRSMIGVSTRYTLNEVSGISLTFNHSKRNSTINADRSMTRAFVSYNHKF